jgi:hypothetical protein
MARPVQVYEELWNRELRNGLRGLTQPDQDLRLEELATLTKLLSECAHPTHCPTLAAWQPSAYRVSGVPGLSEYRGQYPLRVIARWIGPFGLEKGLILLVAPTFSHDHRRLREIIARHRRGIAGWEEP